MAEFEADIEAELEAQSSVGQQEHEASADIQEGPGPEPEADQEVVPPESAATAVDVPGDGALQQQSDLSDTKCCICQQPLRGGGLPAQVNVVMCITRSAWRTGGTFRTAVDFAHTSANAVLPSSSREMLFLHQLLEHRPRRLLDMPLRVMRHWMLSWQTLARQSLMVCSPWFCR